MHFICTFHFTFLFLMRIREETELGFDCVLGEELYELMSPGRYRR